jgi:hypothetical protein
MLPGSSTTWITNSLAEEPLPERVLADLKSGALRIPDGYVGSLGVVVPTDADGETGRSQLLAVCREPPGAEEPDHESFVLPMALMAMMVPLVATLNILMLMPKLLRVVAPRLGLRIIQLTEQLEKELEDMDRQIKEKQKDETVQ